MFWLGPIIAVAGGKLLYDAITDDSGSSSSNRSSVEREYKEDKKEKIQDDISDYIDKQIAFIKQKYNSDITIENNAAEKSTGSMFTNNNITMDDFIIRHKRQEPTVEVINKDEIIAKEIKRLKSNTDELSSVVEILRGAKIETLS